MSRRSLIHEVEARERRTRWFPALAGLTIVALLSATWVGLFTFMGANAAFGTFEDLENDYVPDFEHMDLTLPDLSRVSRVFASEGELLAELHDGRVSEPLPLDQVPELVVDAMLSAEDEDFFEHEGVDFQAIASAAIDNILYDQTRGGSTITQQIVKLNFVGDELTIRRKVAEAFVSAELERRYDKERILEFYLNSVYFGSGAYGVQAAAREFFGKNLDELTVDEAATMAVLVRNPSLYDPRRRPELVQQRRDANIDNMLANGWITASQARRAESTDVEPIEHVPTFSQTDHVVAEVKKELLNDPEFAFLGSTKEARKRAIFGCPADDVTCVGGGGLRIETTVDLDLQTAAFNTLQSWLPLLPYEANLEKCRELFPTTPENELVTYAEVHSCTPTGAIATVDTHTGAIKVMASGLPFEFTQFDLALQGRRNPGSSFKPFGLVTGLENGITLGTYYDAHSPKEIQCPYVCSDRGNVWTVRGGSSGGTITLDRATSSSVNVVYAQLSVEVGPDRIVEVAHRMGIRSELTPVYSLVLGSSAVSPLEMASAYTNFATNGDYTDPYLIERILDSSGNVMYEHESNHRQVGDPAVFAAARRPLTRVPTSAGTARRANIGVLQGGKTGTHQDFKDAWFVGFIPNYATAVWVGYEAEQIPLRNVEINGTKYARVFGGSVPAPIWAEFMTTLVEQKEVGEFPEDPPGVSRYFITPSTIVPPVVGLPVEDALKALGDQARLVVTRLDVPSLEPPGTVISQSLEPGVEVRQGTPIEIRVANGEAPVGNLPNLVGSTFEQALEAIRVFEDQTGVHITLISQDVTAPDPSQVGKIVSTNPGPGSSLGYGAVVTAFIGR